MIYNDDRFLIGLGGNVFENYGKSWKSPSWENVFDTIPPVIQQYTGFMDKNNTPIYEGDIVKLCYNHNVACNNMCHEVKFGKYSCQYGEGYIDDVEYGFYCEELTFGFISSIANPNIKLEVIGNIFENPELLK